MREYAEALTIARAGLEVARAAEYPPLLTLNLTILGTIQRHLGMPATARDLHREALAIDEGGRVPAFTELVLAELCADAARLGDWDEAHARARQARAVRHDAILYAGLSRWCETEALLRAGDHDAAEADARRFGERIGDKRRYRIPYLRALAALAEGRADTGRAIEHLREAATLAEQLKLPGERWAIAAALGELYDARGLPEQARQSFACASTIVRALASELADEEMRATLVAAEPVRRVLARRQY